MAGQVAKTGRPVAALQNAWLELQADLPRLRTHCPIFAQYKLPPVQLSVLGKGENLRTEARLLYSEPVPWTFEPWLLPTNLVREPLISFTVGQGIAPLLRQVKGVPELGLKKLPNQFCLWGLSYVQALSFLTMPVPDASNVLAQLATKLPPLAHSFLDKPAGDILWNSNRADMIWRGWPMAVPELRAVREGGVDYFLGGMFPLLGRDEQAPTELYGELAGRTNLLYYDWEITQKRVIHARQFYQLKDIMNGRRMAPTSAPSQQFLLALAPHLGNTVTEITQSSPKELHLVRKSHIGLAGFELVTLTRWIDSPRFPWLWDPPPLDIRTNRLAATNRVSRAGATNRTTLPTQPNVTNKPAVPPKSPATNPPPESPQRGSSQVPGALKVPATKPPPAPKAASPSATPPLANPDPGKKAPAQP
jgi:hypothetical protein